MNSYSKKNPSVVVKELETFATTLSVDLMKYASIADHDVFLREENKDFLLREGYIWGISLALHISKSACNLLFQHEDEGLMWYFHVHCFGQADLLEAASQKIAAFIDSQGYGAFVVPGRKRVYKNGYPGIISHKSIAILSGMGTIGDNGLLLTPEYGPRVRLSTVLTTLPLPVKPLQYSDNCLHCRKCVEKCPSHAIMGRKFSIQQAKTSLIDENKCNTYRQGRLKRLDTKFCNLCMAVCPVGKEDERAGNTNITEMLQTSIV
jgi:ferredoxin